ncbi:MAG: arginine--tRNA ligase [Candidatus Kapaibacteriales bacterium]
MVFNFVENIFKSSIAKSIGEQYVHLLRFETPKNPDFGDISTNIAMVLAKEIKQNPKQIAQSIIEQLNFDENIIDRITIDGPGFINIKLSNDFYTKQLDKIFEEGEYFGKDAIGTNLRVNVEYVSANPTGLLHLGHGRNACIGDSIANLYEFLGYQVVREYYFNNAGRQMLTLAESIFARYQQLVFDPNFPLPEDGYYGGYVIDIAKELYKKYGKALEEKTPENLEICKKFGEAWCFAKIKHTLEKLNIHHDVFFNEDSLYTEGKIKELLDDFARLGLTYEKDGAIWFRLSKIAQLDDRVIVKSTGEPTYRLPDIAYHREKFRRNFDLIIDVFGADHIATVPDVLAGLEALGYDKTKVKVIIHQFVTLMENGSQVKMSKRSGKSYTLDELIDEVGADVVRFFFLMRSVSTHLEFDLNLARDQSEKNPVYYLQYAYARICSIFDTAKERNIQFNPKVSCLMLNEPQEINLIKTLLLFPDVVKLSAEKFEPQILAEYLKEVATAFHSFYHDCRIIGSEEPLLSARFKLASVTRNVLKNGLQILGISTPERM